MSPAAQDEEEVSDEEVEEQADQKKSKLSAQEAKQLDSVTDFVEEKENSKIDVKEIEAKLNDLRKKKDGVEKQRLEREKQLAAVKIEKADLDFMCTELPLCERDALERLLRVHEGNMVAALRSAVRNFPTSTA
mmetsp:Transcript_29909/g.82112  ORF Transcript_29909/g.82112 Transcript_29909/m.82112 type:complete len:133 (-) Transcript_29909:106-504(-)